MVMLLAALEARLLKIFGRLSTNSIPNPRAAELDLHHTLDYPSMWP